MKNLFKKLENTIGMGPMDTSDDPNIIGEIWPHLGGSTIGFTFGRFKDPNKGTVTRLGWSRGIAIRTFVSGREWLWLDLSDVDIERGIRELCEIYEFGKPGRWLIQRLDGPRWFPVRINVKLKFTKFIGEPGPKQEIKARYSQSSWFHYSGTGLRIYRHQLLDFMDMLEKLREMQVEPPDEFHA